MRATATRTAIKETKDVVMEDTKLAAAVEALSLSLSTEDTAGDADDETEDNGADIDSDLDSESAWDSDTDTLRGSDSEPLGGQYRCAACDSASDACGSGNVQCPRAIHTPSGFVERYRGHRSNGKRARTEGAEAEAEAEADSSMKDETPHADEQTGKVAATGTLTTPGLDGSERCKRRRRDMARAWKNSPCDCDFGDLEDYWRCGHEVPLAVRPVRW
ncbi:hypothetical protein BDW74DRAFT_176623 [Aspergillus multicolor]|uniref:uncharacterized protein n=1 Tax=Aspergillus multicolor TaxID=41759 RepID=UPI003CCDD34D